MGSCLGVQNLLSSRRSGKVSWDWRAAGALHPLVPMAPPRTVWRIRLQDGSVVHCVLWERRPKAAVVWYRDDVVDGVEEFQDPAQAGDWAASLTVRLPIDC